MRAQAVPRAARPSSDAVRAVRRFNRFYTRHLGLLREHLLNSGLSLTEVRVLYEFAHRTGVTSTQLREDLGLDRGYLSRIVGTFEARGWIEAAPAADDRRRIHLSLTGNGRRVFAPLDRRSSAHVAALLGQLSRTDQDRLLAAMRAIETILNPPPRPAAPFILRAHRPGDMGWVVHRHGVLYAQEYGYDERFEALVAGIVSDFIQHFDPVRERCWIAERDGEAVGSVFLVHKSRRVAKLRLLLVEPSARGCGVGQRLVAECVSFARRAGYRSVVLWTQSELHAARRLYEAAGFRRTGRQAHRSWGRRLVAETWTLALTRQRTGNTEATVPTRSHGETETNSDAVRRAGSTERAG
jgi:DNA-binding MarR family transcriptional regulator/ribosomal protein S18 acetylase RimI-like enzyme